MAEVSSLKQELLRDASSQRTHDLRNALGRVCVAIAVARRSLARNDLETLRAMLDEADQEAQRCRTLMNPAEPERH
jgi:hypothetical protein